MQIINRNKIDRYLKLKLYCKDRFVSNDYDIYSIFLCSITGIGKEFFGNDKIPCRKELEYIKILMLRPDTILELIVQTVQDADGNHCFFIADTEFVF